MRFLVPLFVVLAVAAFHTVLSASLETAEKEEEVTHYDGLTELQKIDQMEFEAAQKEKAVQLNVTEEQHEETRYLEAVQDGSMEEHSNSENESKAEQKGNSDAAAHDESESESSEDTDGRQRREHEETVTETVRSLDEVSQDSPTGQDV